MIDLKKEYEKLLIESNKDKEKLINCLLCLERYYKINPDKRLKILLKEYGIFDKKE